MKIREWFYWAGIIVYCTAVFLLSRERSLILVSLFLSFFPAVVLFIPRHSAHRAMVDYLSENDPEVLDMIAREQFTSRLWGRPRHLFYVKDACSDPEYLELRKKYKKIFLTQMLLVGTSIVTYFYFRFTFAG